MGISLDALEVLDAIDRRGSFAAAAIELGRVPSAITYTVRRLEDELDALLFDRRGRRATLTPAGRELLASGRRLLAEAAALEQRVQRISTGWEAELRIAVDSIVPMASVWPLCARFYADCSERRAAHTRLVFSAEVLGGAWDALAEGRVDLVVGASGEAPPGGGWRTRLMAEIPMLFAVAPGHPLADAPEPLPEAAIATHRSVVAADSSRKLAPRSVGTLDGQETLIVPDLAAKLAAQVAGLGCGWLPGHLVADAIPTGRLVVKATEVPRRDARVQLVWRDARPGKALAWWIDAVMATDWRFLALGVHRDRPVDPAPPVRSAVRRARAATA
jgi:DNA-binding transcriptional LysR family regulator